MANPNNFMTKKEHTNSTPQGEWHVLDAKKKVLGRLATEAASLLLGKHRSDWAPNKVAPVFVVVINTDSVRLTGDKANQKTYHRYSGYSGGLKTRTFREQMQRDSRFVVREAVLGMLPKNLLRDDRLNHLRMYPGADHPHLPQTNKPAAK